jgi:hypothetical protein
LRQRPDLRQIAAAGNDARGAIEAVQGDFEDSGC